MYKIKIFSLFVGLALITIVGCDNDNNDNPTPVTPALGGSLNLEFSNLSNLGDAHAYEGWIIVDGSPVSTGTFTVDDSGVPSKTSFSINQEELDKATSFILTIEPSPDSDPKPTETHLVAGDFSGDEAIVSVADTKALDNDYTTAAGEYILAAPTTELSGVWFLKDPGGTGKIPTLSLPILKEGWKYEGWAVVDGTPVSTGTFTSVSSADDSNIYSGPGGAPLFPGEDFIKNAPTGVTFPTDLTGAKIVVSVEPDPDNDPKPFVLKPLVGDVPTGITSKTPKNMVVQPSPFTTATATRTTATENNLTINIVGLTNLGDNFKYEGWVVDTSGAAPVPTSTGVFTVADDGTLSATSFSVDQAKLDAAALFVLSIEPTAAPDLIPSETKMLAGIFDSTSNVATLGFGDFLIDTDASAGNATDFSGATGEYILATPTDDVSGIWWLKEDASKAKIATLTLPDAPAGWKYEGWAVVDGTPVSTGTFTKVSGADSGNPFSGLQPAPPFPGEDFIKNAPTGITFPLDLRKGKAVISIEPDPDNDPAPFALKPLVGDIPATATEGAVQSMGKNLGNFPTGKAKR